MFLNTSSSFYKVSKLLLSGNYWSYFTQWWSNIFLNKSFGTCTILWFSKKNLNIFTSLPNWRTIFLFFFFIKVLQTFSSTVIFAMRHRYSCISNENRHFSINNNNGSHSNYSYYDRPILQNAQKGKVSLQPPKKIIKARRPCEMDPIKHKRLNNQLRGSGATPWWMGVWNDTHICLRRVDK